MTQRVTDDSVLVETALVLRISGQLTGDALARVTRAADHRAGPPPASVLVLDLRDLDPLKVSGVAPLLAAVERCAARGIRCRAVVEPGDAVSRVLDAAGAPASLPRFADVEQALAGTTLAPADPGDTTLDFDVLSAQLELLTRGLLGTPTVGAALRQVVDATTVVVPAADLVSVTLRDPDGAVLTPVRTDEVAVELDRVQYNAGEGPCLDAAHPTGPAYALSEDLAAERRWPDFVAAATLRGFQSVISTELIPGAGPDRRSGALNIYSRKSHGLSDNDRYAALLLATHAALALAHAHTTELADVHAIELHRAIDSRDVIGQAKGILMNRQGITADEAFELLRATSQHLNVKLVDLARTLTARHGELDRS